MTDEEKRERRREKDRLWRLANPEKARERDRRKRLANPERARESNRRWYAKHREEVREKGREKRRLYPEERREYMREYMRRWYAEHREVGANVSFSDAAHRTEAALNGRRPPEEGKPGKAARIRSALSRETPRKTSQKRPRSPQ